MRLVPAQSQLCPLRVHLIKHNACRKPGCISSVACKCQSAAFVNGQVGGWERLIICRSFKKKKLALSHLGSLLYVISTCLITVRDYAACEGT